MSEIASGDHRQRKTEDILTRALLRRKGVGNELINYLKEEVTQVIVS